jgi:hypothetical protein
MSFARHAQPRSSPAAASPQLCLLAASASRPLAVPAKRRHIVLAGAGAASAAPSAPSEAAPGTSMYVDLGYDRDLEAKYAVGAQLGKGEAHLARQAGRRTLAARPSILAPISRTALPQPSEGTHPAACSSWWGWGVTSGSVRWL